VDGFEHALQTGAAIALVGALLSAILVRREPALDCAGRPGGGARPSE
jgi:hypothetical protein